MQPFLLGEFIKVTAQGKTTTEKATASLRKKKSGGNKTIAHEWAILKLLPLREPGKTAVELKQELQDQGFDVGLRTVQRYMKMLVEIFEIEQDDDGRAFRWYWVSANALGLPGLTLPEALSLHMMDESMRTLVPDSMLASLKPRFVEAARKLESLGDANRVVRWKNKVRIVQPALPRILPRIADGILEKVQEVLLNEKQIRVDYQAAGATKPKQHILNPLAIVHRGPIIYLVATIASQPEKGPITWSLYRMSSVENIYIATDIPKDFDLDDYIARGALQFGSGKRIQLVAQVSKRLADELAEARLSEDQSFNEDRTQVSATVADTWQLHWWILSKAEEIVVIEPLELRHEIVKKLQAAVGGYANLIDQGTEK